MLGPGGSGEINRVGEDVVGHRHCADELLDGENVLPGDNGRGLWKVPDGGAADDFNFLIACRIAEIQREHETIELCLGQWISTLVFDRVLGGDDEKRIRQSAVLTGDGDAAFLHRL